jgi:hypothetical protein
MYQGKYIFSQLQNFIPRYQFQKCVNKYKGDFRIRTLRCWDQFLAMMFGQLMFRDSLSSLVICLLAQKNKLYHLGFSVKIVKRTLFDANEKRDWRIYQDFALILIQEARSLYIGDNEFLSRIDGTVYALDASIIDLCLRVFKWAKFRKKKGAIKLHVAIDLQGNIPTFIHITDGKVHDVNALDILEIEIGAYYIMDRGYLDYKRLYKIHKRPAFFITRAKKNTKVKRIYSNKVDRSTGIICDQIVVFTGYYAFNNYSAKLRHIKYYDKEKGKHLIFLTNNFELDALVIIELYKQRWQIELFFKWIKQHLKVKVFWGRSENAVKVQIWIAICTYLIVAIMKKKLKLEQNLYEILQILSVSTFDKTELESLFTNDSLQNQITDSQMSLF